MVRLIFEVFTYQIEIDGYLVGPDGSEGFRDIRAIYEQDISQLEYMFVIYAILAVVLVGFLILEKSRLGAIFRMVGEDAMLTEMQGLNATAYKLLAAAMAGFVAGLGGGLYAHLMTYLEPKIFNAMLGVHSLAYGLIGGLGTFFGPLIGVVLDIGFLESIRVIHGYRMIVFGGLVSLMLIFMPRGILDENRVYKLKYLTKRLLRD